MALLSTSGGNSAPANVGTGNFIYTVTGTHACGGTVQPFVLDAAMLTVSPPISAGRWVLLKAGSISGYAGSTVDSSATGLTVRGVSQENVNFGGTSFPCIVVTLA